jgi:hypothetical protein
LRNAHPAFAAVPDITAKGDGTTPAPAPFAKERTMPHHFCTTHRVSVLSHSQSFMKPILISIFLLLCSNVFMTFAWYAHLKELNNKPWLIAALVSWGIALIEYIFQVPANRIGYSVLSVGQLKIMQEIITLTVFVPFSVMYLKEPLKLDYLWAGLCLLGAVFFMFRGKFV